MKCPRKGCNHEARLHPVYGVLPCLECQAKDPAASTVTRDPILVGRLHRIQKQQDQHGKDMLQPFFGDKPNPEFIASYPELVHDYFTDAQLKESGVYGVQMFTRYKVVRARNLTIGGKVVEFKGLRWPWVKVKEQDAAQDMFVLWPLSIIYRIYYRIRRKHA